MKKRIFLCLIFSICAWCMFAQNVEQRVDINYDYLDYYNKPVLFASLTGNSVKVSLNSVIGTFSLYAGKNRFLKSRILASSDSGKTSSFFLKIDDSVYRLNNTSAASKWVRRRNGGLQLVYTFRKKARVILDFKLGCTGDRKYADVISIDVYVTNLSSRKHKFDLKAIFDTALSDNSDFAYLTASNRIIDSGCVFTSDDYAVEKWLSLASGRTTVQIPFIGKNLSVPECVTVGNLSVLEKMNWYTGRERPAGFNDSATSMNPAVMFDWDEFALSPEKTKLISLCFVAGVDGFAPETDDVIVGKVSYAEYGLKLEDIINADESVDDENAVTADENPVSEDNSAISEPKTDFSEVSVPENQAPEVTEPVETDSASVENAKIRNDVEFSVVEVYDYQLDPDYIQRLIDRINEMQSDSDTVDHEEVMLLNAELDAILEKLGRTKR